LSTTIWWKNSYFWPWNVVPFKYKIKTAKSFIGILVYPIIFPNVGLPNGVAPGSLDFTPSLPYQYFLPHKTIAVCQTPGKFLPSINLLIPKDICKGGLVVLPFYKKKSFVRYKYSKKKKLLRKIF
jgi:hypothetical protein